MTQDEIRAHARRIAREWLEDGIESCYVWEDEELGDSDIDDVVAIEKSVRELIMGLAKGIVV